MNEQPEYHSPDKNIPIIVTDPGEEGNLQQTEYDIVERLGGGKLEASSGRFKCYKLNDGQIIHIKRSKFHPAKNYYWYGISTAALNYMNQFGVTDVIFIMGDEGYVKVSLQIVKDFIKNTTVSRNPDGTIRHYHCLISPGPEPDLFWSEEVPKFSLVDYYSTF